MSSLHIRFRLFLLKIKKYLHLFTKDYLKQISTIPKMSKLYRVLLIPLILNSKGNMPKKSLLSGITKVAIPLLNFKIKAISKKKKSKKTGKKKISLKRFTSSRKNRVHFLFQELVEFHI